MQDVKHYKESFFYTRFWIVVLIVVGIFLGISTVRAYKKYTYAKTIRDDYAQELVQVQQSKEVLEKNIHSLSTDRGKEIEIRDRYRVVKEGEQMILIVDNYTTQEDPILQNEPENEQSFHFWEKLITFFKGL
jgi:cell division protein FtsB